MDGCDLRVSANAGQAARIQAIVASGRSVADADRADARQPRAATHASCRSSEGPDDRDGAGRRASCSSRSATGGCRCIALLPTAVGLIWAAGVLAMAGVELDLFAVFAVVTFVGIGVDYGIHLVHRFHERGDAERATVRAGAGHPVGSGDHAARLRHARCRPIRRLRSIGIVSAASVVALAAASVLFLPALLLSEARRAGDERGRGRGGSMTLRPRPSFPRSTKRVTIRPRSCRAFAASVDHVIVVDDGSTDRTAERARAAGAEVIVAPRQPRQGTRGPHRARAGARGEFHARAAARRRHAASARGGRGARSPGGSRGADVVLGERQIHPDEMPASRYHANRIGSRVLSWFVGVPVEDTQCGFRVFRVDALRPLRSDGHRLRDRNGNARQGPPARWPRRRPCRSPPSTPDSAASSGR